MKLCSRGIALTACLCLAANPANAQPVRVTLNDGSILRGTLTTSTITVTTAYGDLSIPSSDVQSIQFGLHFHDGEEAAIAKAVRLLASDVHRERETATRDLIQRGRTALPALAIAMRSTDVETAKRATAITAAIVEADPRPVLTVDAVRAKQFPVAGRVKGEALTLTSATLGTLTIKYADLREVTATGADSGTFTVDAAKETWTTTGVQARTGERLLLRATGTIDLWPQGPWQYLSGPKGSNETGKGGLFLMGALIARIGGGSPFLVGDGIVTQSRESGTVELMIVPSTWNSAAAGEYRVEVRVGE